VFAGFTQLTISCAAAARLAIGDAAASVRLSEECGQRAQQEHCARAYDTPPQNRLAMVHVVSIGCWWRRLASRDMMSRGTEVISIAHRGDLEPNEAPDPGVVTSLPISG